MTSSNETLASPPVSAPAASSTYAVPAASSAYAPSRGAERAQSLFERVADAWADRWNAMIATDAFQRWSARFPLTRPVALRRSRALFDVCAGFVYTQTLLACVELDLFERLSGGAMDVEAIARSTGLTVASTERLLNAATSLKLVVRRRDGRFALGPLGAPMVGNGGLKALVRHHRIAYEDLREPVALLRAGAEHATALAHYWPYADTARPDYIDDARVASYSEMMSATLPPLAEDVLDVCDLSSHRCLMDVGGGEGVFVSLAAKRYPTLQLKLFDLPSVAARARTRLDRLGLAPRTECIGGDFHGEPLPTGADVCTLVRVLLDHDDASVLRLLQRVREALPPRGKLIIAEAMAGVRGAETVGDAYFSFYLLAMGKGRARRPSELRAMLTHAGFRRIREHTTRYPVQNGLIVAET